VSPHSSSLTTAEYGREVSAKWLHSYISLLGSYHHHVIGTFNTCSRRPTHWSLIDIGGGYNLGGAGLPYTTPRPSQLTVFTFHLAPPGLRLFIQSFSKDLEREQTLNDLHSASTVSYHLGIACPNGNHQMIG
jgi:hypothetical protein